MSVIKDFKFAWKNGPLLFDINKLELPDEGLSVIMGPSGCGKSSLVRCLVGLEPCSGEWIYNEQDLMKLSVSDRNFAVVFQSLDLFPHMTAKQNIMFSAESRGISKKDAEFELNKLVEILGLQACLAHKGRQLSGGEAQRVAMARALICKPSRLFLDEPFSSLDIENKSQARDLLKNIINEFKIPTIMITHDKEDAELLADYSFLFEDRSVTRV